MIKTQKKLKPALPIELYIKLSVRFQTFCLFTFKHLPQSSPFQNVLDATLIHPKQVFCSTLQYVQLLAPKTAVKFSCRCSWELRKCFKSAAGILQYTSNNSKILPFPSLFKDQLSRGQRSSSGGLGVRRPSWGLPLSVYAHVLSTLIECKVAGDGSARVR